jgi:hypothetical protein
MSRHYIKTGVVSLLTVVLLYYSVAWAVLRCFHDEDHSTEAGVVSASDPHAKDAHFPFSHHAQANLDCIGSNCHTESLAGPASPTELHRLTSRLAFRVTDDLTLPGLAADGSRGIRLSPVIFQAHPPRYLSLSIFRI